MGLTLLAAQGAHLVDYTAAIASLEMTSVMPGGFGQLHVRLRLPGERARLAHPELAVMSAQIALLDGKDCVFTGEVFEAAQVLDAQGEGIDLVAMGGGGALRDDPGDASYTNATAGAIIADQFARRSAYLAVDPDLAAVLPDAPTATFSPVFDGRTIEDILHELCDLLGDYTWGVWDHPTHRDARGLPTWQLVVHQRDLTTPHYAATVGDVVNWRVAPAASRAFNGVTLHYLDPVNGPGAVTVTDPRLNGDLSQGNAPFRFRRFRRDLGQRPLTAVQAQSLANHYLASFQNLQNVTTLTLTSVRNIQGGTIPLWRVRADHNIAVPELLPRAATFSVPPVFASGVNLFSIRQTHYREVAGQMPTLTLSLDQIDDFAAADVARQRYEEQLRQRSRRLPPTTQPVGQALKGYFSVRWGASSGASNVWGGAIQFPTVMVNVPTGVTFTTLSSSNIAAGPTIGNITRWGCDVQVTASTAGAGFWTGTYMTIGN